MYLATSKSCQFMERTGNESTKGSRKGFSILGGGEDVLMHLTPKEKRESLQKYYKYLHEKRSTKEGKKDKELGQEIWRINQELAQTSKKINKELRSSTGSIFMELCRQEMPALKFKMLLDKVAKIQKHMESSEA
jgi:hypothetical protein